MLNMVKEWNNDNQINEEILKDAFTLIIYDIENNKRRAKFAKLMESYGVRVQLSAFEIRVSGAKLTKLINSIPRYISKDDSVKLYQIRGDAMVKSWGKNTTIGDGDVYIV